MTTLSLDALTVPLSESTRAEIAEADVIVAVDLSSQAEFTVYGTPPLESTISLKHPLAMKTVRIAFNRKSGGLDKVVAMVRTVKGRDAIAGTDE